MTNPRWTRRPSGSNWGDFGVDDELGRLNLLTAAKVKQAIAEVLEGKTFCLSLPLDCPSGALSPRRKPPRLVPTLRDGGVQNMNYPARLDTPNATDIISDDEVTLSLQYSSHWDSLAHVGQRFDIQGDGQLRDVYYNGFLAGRDILGPTAYNDGDATVRPEDSGARHLDVQTIALSCVQTRGVMVDLDAHFGRTGKVVGYSELRHILDADRVVVEEGDILCLHTGFARMLLEMGDDVDRERLFNTNSALDGRDTALHDWITDCGVAAIAADNFSVEAFPARGGSMQCCAKLPLHEHCLFRLGIPLGELWYLSELADWLRAHQRSRFMLTAPPLRLPRAVGSPVTPIATV